MKRSMPTGYDMHKSIVHRSVSLGRDSVVWAFTTIREGTEIGSQCAIGSCCYIGMGCKIGNNVRIQHGVFLPDGMEIEDDVFIGPNATFTDDRHPRSNNPLYIREPSTLRERCSIGAGAIILPGVVIGHDVMVGAGAVVTRNVPPLATVTGIPACIVTS